MNDQSSSRAASTTSKQVRDQIIDALRLDLIGPRPGYAPHAEYAEEVLPVAPSRWYLSGFLVPYEAPMSQRGDDDGDDDNLDLEGRASGGDDEAQSEKASARKALFPSSMGLSVLVPGDAAELVVRVAWADYRRVQDDAGGRWQRVPRSAECVVALSTGTHAPVGLASHDDLHVVVSVRPVKDTALVPAGTRSVSVFLVNQRAPAATSRPSGPAICGSTRAARAMTSPRSTCATRNTTTCAGRCPRPWCATIRCSAGARAGSRGWGRGCESRARSGTGC